MTRESHPHYWRPPPPPVGPWPPAQQRGPRKILHAGVGDPRSPLEDPRDPKGGPQAVFAAWRAPPREVHAASRVCRAPTVPGAPRKVPSLEAPDAHPRGPQASLWGPLASTEVPHVAAGASSTHPKGVCPVWAPTHANGAPQEELECPLAAAPPGAPRNAVEGTVASAREPSRGPSGAAASSGGPLVSI